MDQDHDSKQTTTITKTEGQSTQDLHVEGTKTVEEITQQIHVFAAEQFWSHNCQWYISLPMGPVDMKDGQFALSASSEGKILCTKMMRFWSKGRVAYCSTTKSQQHPTKMATLKLAIQNKTNNFGNNS